jgi:hypothetical protein
MQCKTMAYPAPMSQPSPQSICTISGHNGIYPKPHTPLCTFLHQIWKCKWHSVFYRPMFLLPIICRLSNVTLVYQLIWPAYRRIFNKLGATHRVGITCNTLAVRLALGVANFSLKKKSVFSGEGELGTFKCMIWLHFKRYFSFLKLWIFLVQT